MQHFLNIPYYNAFFLLDRSSPPSPPVTPMTDSNCMSMNEEMNMGDAARQAAVFFEQLLHSHNSMPNAAAQFYGDQRDQHAAAAQIVMNLQSPSHAGADSASLYATAANMGCGSSPAAMLQLLSALDGGGHHRYQEALHMSAPAAQADYQQLLGCGNPATFNFFQPNPQDNATPLHNLHHHAGHINDHHQLELAHGACPIAASSYATTPGFLNLFNDLHDVDLNQRSSGVSLISAAPAAEKLPLANSSCLQLQPLEVHPSLGSTPTLYQKRVSQRSTRQHGSARQLGAPSSYTGTSYSPAFSESQLQLGVPSATCTSTPLTATKSPSSLISMKQQLSGSSSASAAALSDGPPQSDLPESDDAGPAGVAKLQCGNANHSIRTHNQLVGLGIVASGHGFTSAAHSEEDNCAEALFHMHDPELQRIEAVQGSASICLHGHTTDDDELLLLQSDAGEEMSNLQLAAASASERHAINNSVTIPTRGNGRGKVKGPPAKNLMAERRRRKKLNDRLYTLRSVVPKISKMDRASILGDAIDYLKELLQRINDLHNELEASIGTPAPQPNAFPQPNPNIFGPNQSSSSLISFPAGSSGQPVKLEDCPSTAYSTTHLQLQSVAASAAGSGSGSGADPSQPPKIEVRLREGRALNIHMFCGKRPGLLLATMRALDGLGLDVQQAVISCFNGFALDVFRAEQSPEEELVEAEEIKRVLLHTAMSTSASGAGGAGSGGSYVDL